jgi:D-alanyl-D-alanine carboxypeptidase
MLALCKKAVATAVALAISLPASAGPTLLFDAADGRVLYAEDPDNQWHPASLTKIMTAYLAFQAIKEGKLTLDQKIPCTELAHSQPPSKIGLAVGTELTIKTALQALVLKSANDVAVMLAEAIAGTHDAFVERMNATATRLGMTRTKFVNPNGLPADEQVTTARDLAKLTTAVLRDFPEYGYLWSAVDMRLGKRRLRTHNSLLTRYEGADGIKTGFICDSGFNVVASATREGHRLIAVVLGEATGRQRTARAANLLEHGFQTYKWKELLGAPSLDKLPMAEDPKGAVTMRKEVKSYACGTGHRRSVAKHKRRKRGVVHKRARTRQSARQRTVRQRAAKARARQKAAAAEALH